jgi:glutamine synthetase
MTDVRVEPGELEGLGVEAVRVVYTDLHGMPRGKDIPLSKFPHLAEEGVAFCAAVMSTDLRHTPVVGGEEGYVDFAVRPDLGTLRVVPWQPELALCIGDVMELDGSGRHPTCARSLLARLADRYAERGLVPTVGPELEFFLLEADADAPGGLRRYVDELSRVYTVGPISDPRGIALEMLLACDRLGLRAFAANHEFMSSQYEINVEHSDALDAADRAFLLKATVKELAIRNGLVATFMGKPFNDQGGSGFHFHLSLADGEGGNAFDDDGDPAGLGTLRGSFVAGLLEHGPALMAFLAPTVNAYKRLIPDSLAPTHVNWGHDNRTSFVRVPAEHGSRSRIEVRAGDGSACAHLATAALLLAGLDGIERELEPPAPVVGDAYRADEAHAGSRLPASLGASLDALEADEWMCEGLGAGLVETFLAMKRFELDRFATWVTDWELDEYARHL